MKTNKPVLVRREVTRYGRFGDLFTVCLDDDALWLDDSVCQGDFVICTRPYETSDPIEVSGLTYKLMIKDHNDMLGASPILNINERRYLSEVIGPFRDKVLYIYKCQDDSFDEEYIVIKFKNQNDNCIIFPNFRKGDIYKGMEEGKKYTIEELGL